jgi:preflagellin peptidase FlaK
MNTYRYEKHGLLRIMILPLLISTTAVILTLLYASFRDILERRVPFRTWYPMLAIGLPAVTWFYFSLLQGGGWQPVLFFLLLTGLFSLFFYLFAFFHLFGGADAWALIFIAVCIPFFPFEPALGYPPLRYFPLTVLTNAVVLNLVTPVIIFLQNIVRRHKAPLPYLFLGFPVRGDDIGNTFGYVMEEIGEEEGAIRRRFIPIGSAMKSMLQGERRLYTKEMGLHPEEYATELALFRRAGTVWISYGVPFIVPITAGLITALLAGDLLFSAMMFVRGM